MILVKPSHEILTDCLTTAPKYVKFPDLRIIEKAGRVCYKSEERMTPGINTSFIEGILKRGHESVIEHASITVKFICDRGVSHELVRHRLCSFSQESTRYCDYKGSITYIVPPWIYINELDLNKNITGGYDMHWIELAEDTKSWLDALMFDEQKYNKHRTDYGWSPEKARGLLPINLKTEIVVTANLREWRHILKLRAVGTTGKPHPQMSELMVPLLKEFKEKIPVIFDDLEVKE